MAEPRNNIYRHWPRPVKVQLVRWREISGYPTGKVIKLAHAEHPDLPRIHPTTWNRWRRSDEYRELLSKVMGEEKSKEIRTDLFLAAGGVEALADQAKAAAYALAIKAADAAEDTADPREIRSLMATALDGIRIAESKIREECEAQAADKDAERMAQIEEIRAELAKVRSENERLRGLLDRKTGAVDPDERRRLIDAFDEFVGKPQGT